MAPETTRPQAETRTITVSVQRLRVAIRKGDGKADGTRMPLLLLNGIGVNLEVLQQFVDALDPAIEVIRFDVPGTGGSPAPRTPYFQGKVFSLSAWLLASHSTSGKVGQIKGTKRPVGRLRPCSKATV